MHSDRLRSGVPSRDARQQPVLPGRGLYQAVGRQCRHHRGLQPDTGRR